MGDDLAVVRERLGRHDRAAGKLPWAKERRWRAASHVRWDGELLVVDLHDLGAALAREVVEDVAGIAPRLDTGAVCLITGRGRHSLGKGVLGDVVREVLGSRVGEEGWTLRPLGPGRLVLVTDPARAPAAATGELGWGFVALLVLFAIAVAVVLLSKLLGT